MEYKGYSAIITYDDRDELLHGRILHIHDSVTFEGTSVHALKKAFRDSVDVYLAHCATIGKPADKPFSGSLRLQLDPALHCRAAMYAAKLGKSLNDLIIESVESNLPTA